MKTQGHGMAICLWILYENWLCFLEVLLNSFVNKV